MNSAEPPQKPSIEQLSLSLPKPKLSLESPKPLTNPLGVPQREIAGATTLGKYEYQYHWALWRILEESKDKKVYAVILEYHEDVVIADSLDYNTARFEFNQIKNITSKKLTEREITKKENNKNSILGKLISSCVQKSYTSKISAINLVATCGFSFKFLNKNYNLDCISLKDLEQKSVDHLKNSIKDELSAELPDSICFIIPTLSPLNQQEACTGKISTVIDLLYPDAACKAINIYRTLMDDLRRKGQNSKDFREWQEFLSEKSLTSDRVYDVMSKNIKDHSPEIILKDAAEIGELIGLPFSQRKELKNNISNIHIKMTGLKTSKLIKIKEEINFTFGKISNIKNLEPPELIERIMQLINKEKINLLLNMDDIPLRDYIIYEIIIWYNR